MNANKKKTPNVIWCSSTSDSEPLVMDSVRPRYVIPKVKRSNVVSHESSKSAPVGSSSDGDCGRSRRISGDKERQRDISSNDLRRRLDIKSSNLIDKSSEKPRSHGSRHAKERHSDESSPRRSSSSRHLSGERTRTSFKLKSTVSHCYSSSQESDLPVLESRSRHKSSKSNDSNSPRRKSSRNYSPRQNIINEKSQSQGRNRVEVNKSEFARSSERTSDRFDKSANASKLSPKRSSKIIELSPKPSSKKRRHSPDDFRDSSKSRRTREKSQSQTASRSRR